MKENRQNKNSASDPKIITCERCYGSGLNHGEECSVCLGAGIAMVLGDSVFYWGRKINFASILERRTEIRLRAIINVLFLFFGVAGFLFLVLHIYKIGVENIFTRSLWLGQGIEMFVFWLSALADMYLLYRMEKESEIVDSVKSKKYNEVMDIFLGDDPWKAITELPRAAKIDISRSFSTEALTAIEDSHRLAGKFKHPEIRPLHILAALLFFQKANLIFARLGISTEDFAKKLNHALNQQDFSYFTKANGAILGNTAKKVLLLAYFEAYKSRAKHIEINDLIIVIAKTNNTAEEILYDLGIEFDDLENVVEWIKIGNTLVSRSKKFASESIFKPKGNMNRAMTAVATPVLDRFSTDLTHLAKNGYIASCVGRDKEIESIFRMLEGSARSVILAGHPGVGKNTIIEGIARLMVTEDVPKIIKDKRLVKLSVARLISGAAPHEAQGRLMEIIREVRRSGNIVLFISGVQDMIGITPGGKESLDLSEVIVEQLSQGAFFMFATANISDYVKYIENTALGEILAKVDIKEPEEKETIYILEAKSFHIEYENQVYFSYDAIVKAVKFSRRFLHDHFLPEKAVLLLEEAAVFTRKKKGPRSVILGEDIADLISQKINIPLTKITEEESEKLLNLEEVIHDRIIGQDEAVKMVARALRRSRTELRDRDRPIANFLFLGPTGVGKTELSKVVAEVYFGNEKAMTRIDMSEYQSQENLYRLIGAPPGSGSDGSPGQLTEAVRKNPFTIVLLDELEKAHPEILNLFLQVMEDGRLTDGMGKTIDFTNVILIATSNAGTKFIQEKTSENWSTEDITNYLLEEEIKKYFRPEFINRFDGIIVFKPLGVEEVKKIARILLSEVEENLSVKGISLEVKEEAIDFLAREGYNPQYGARPLRRVIQNYIDDTLARYLLSNKIGRRDKVIIGGDGAIEIQKARKL